MPEALVNVPTLQIPSGISSEAGNSSTAAETTDRSTDSRNYNQVGVNEKMLNAKSQGKRRSRKSNGRRLQKKTQLKPLNSEKKVASVLKLKSRIPRALVLTPSSSTASLVTSDSLPSPLIPIDKVHTEKEELETTTSNRSCLVRQETAVILAFRQRKSVSQMDFSYARRQMNFPIPSPPLSRHGKVNNGSDNALMPSSRGENIPVAYSNHSFVHKIYNQDYYFAMPERDPQMAGLRIFAIIMLNAWRKRRDEVRSLRDEVADLKRSAIKSKNQMHVFSSLFRVEQKRNDELNCQLKRSLEDINLAKSSCESLTTSLISLKADKALLEQQLLIKEQEYESVTSFLTQTKSDLFKTMTVQRELQALLSTEQRNIQALENQKNELVNEICELNSEALQKEEDLRKEVQEKCVDLSKIKTKLIAAEERIKILHESNQQQASENKTQEDRMRQEIEALQNELKSMHRCLEETLGNRFKNCWNNSVTCQKVTLEMLHWLAYYALPAMPPPKMKTLPFRLSLNKALSIVNR